MANSKNKFPKHLERDMELIYKQAITRLGRTYLPEIKRAYRDSATLQEFNARLNILYNRQIDTIIAGALLNKVDKNVEVISAWAFSQTKKAINNLRNIDKVTRIASVTINQESTLYGDFVNSYKTFNKNLVKTLGREYIDEVSNLAANTYTQGLSVKDLTKQLLDYTEGDINKAKFWARDQVGDAFSAFTKNQQTSAGITNYIWQTVEDNRVRTTHGELQNRVFSWASGAASTGLLSKPGAAHPGEDYNCRCYPEPTTMVIA